jgi:hypothetical protein
MATTATTLAFDTASDNSGNDAQLRFTPSSLISPDGNLKLDSLNITDAMFDCRKRLSEGRHYATFWRLVLCILNSSHDIKHRLRYKFAEFHDPYLLKGSIPCSLSVLLRGVFFFSLVSGIFAFTAFGIFGF